MSTQFDPSKFTKEEQAEYDKAMSMYQEAVKASPARAKELRSAADKIMRKLMTAVNRRTEITLDLRGEVIKFRREEIARKNGWVF